MISAHGDWFSKTREYFTVGRKNFEIGVILRASNDGALELTELKTWDFRVSKTRSNDEKMRRRVHVHQVEDLRTCHEGFGKQVNRIVDSPWRQTYRGMTLTLSACIATMILPQRTLCPEHLQSEW